MAKITFRKNENMKIAIREKYLKKNFKRYKEKFELCENLRFQRGGYMNNYNNVMGLQNCSDMGF